MNSAWKSYNGLPLAYYPAGNSDVRGNENERASSPNTIYSFTDPVENAQSHYPYSNWGMHCVEYAVKKTGEINTGSYLHYIFEPDVLIRHLARVTFIRTHAPCLQPLAHLSSVLPREVYPHTHCTCQDADLERDQRRRGSAVARRGGERAVEPRGEDRTCVGHHGVECECSRAADGGRDVVRGPRGEGGARAVGAGDGKEERAVAHVIVKGR